jgi:hypothetical protein
MAQVCLFIILVIRCCLALLALSIFTMSCMSRVSVNIFLSTQKLVHDNNAFMELHPSFFCVKDQATQRVLFHGRNHNGLYPVPCPVLSSCSSSHAALSSVTASVDLWHHRLGHPSSSIIESIVRSNNLACAPRPMSSLVCDPCHRANVHQLPFNNCTHVITSPLELVHSDVWGPAVSSVHGFKYYVSFLVDFSRFTWIRCQESFSFVSKAC